MITGKSFGKINLFLKVTGKRDDGYHNICTLFSRISVFDLVCIEKSERFNIVVNREEIPTDENNIVFKVWKQIKNMRKLNDNLSVRLFKNIPSGAGLGGGSSNAATFLNLADTYLGLKLSFDERLKIMANVGSDTCFFLYDRPMIGISRGERLSYVPVLPQMKLLIVKPDFSISTEKIYKSEFLRLTPDFSQPSEESLKDFNALTTLMENDLETPAFRLCPSVEYIKTEMLNLGAVKSLMSGSGSSVFGVFQTDFCLEKAFAYFRNRYSKYFVAKSYNF